MHRLRAEESFTVPADYFCRAASGVNGADFRRTADFHTTDEIAGRVSGDKRAITPLMSSN